MEVRFHYCMLSFSAHNGLDFYLLFYSFICFIYYISCIIIHWIVYLLYNYIFYCYFSLMHYLKEGYYYL